jgi:plastocyanin
MQFTTLALAALASLASAQRTWVVTVAQNGSFTYSPERLAPQPGEFVQFQFHAGNHTVTQSTFGAPCTPIGMTNTNVTGFHSGFLPVAASAEMGMIPTYTIQVNDTNPIWMYCAKGPHCQNGMVMVINEPLVPIPLLSHNLDN